MLCLLSSIIFFILPPSFFLLKWHIAKRDSGRSDLVSLSVCQSVCLSHFFCVGSKNMQLTGWCFVFFNVNTHRCLRWSQKVPVEGDQRAPGRQNNQQEVPGKNRWRIAFIWDQHLETNGPSKYPETLRVFLGPETLLFGHRVSDICSISFEHHRTAFGSHFCFPYILTFSSCHRR